METKENPSVFDFKRVVFGVNSSPFLAQFVIQEYAQKHQSQFPLWAETVLKSTYMDDSMDPVPDKETGIALYKQLPHLWASAGMHARKWLSNVLEVLEHIPQVDLDIEEVCCGPPMKMNSSTKSIRPAEISTVLNVRSWRELPPCSTLLGSSHHTSFEPG